jgi:hypothetical protein
MNSKLNCEKKVERETLERERYLEAAVGGDETECGLGFADVTPPSSFISFVQSFNFESSFFFYFSASVVFGLRMRDLPIFLGICLHFYFIFFDKTYHIMLRNMIYTYVCR